MGDNISIKNFTKELKQYISNDHIGYDYNSECKIYYVG